MIAPPKLTKEQYVAFLEGTSLDEIVASEAVDDYLKGGENRRKRGREEEDEQAVEAPPRPKDDERRSTRRNGAQARQ